MLKRETELITFLLIALLILSGCSSDGGPSAGSNPNNVVVSVEGGGEVTQEDSGSKTELKAQPDDGSIFLRWEGDIVSTNNPEYVNNTEVQDITAVFVSDSSLDNGVFKLINSWGKEFGPNNDGAFYMTYEAAIKNEVYVTMFEPNDNYEPKAVALINISNPSREDVEIKLSNGQKDKKLYSNKVDMYFSNEYNISDYEFYYKGGSIPFPNNNIVIDITDLLPLDGELSLEITNDSSASAYISEFSLELYDDYSSQPEEVYSKDINGSIEVAAGDTDILKLENIFTEQSYISSAGFSYLEGFSRSITKGDIENYDEPAVNQSLSSGKKSGGLLNLTKLEHKKALEDNLIQKLDTSLLAASFRDVDAVDNSQSKYFPPVGNQKQEGSCVSWSMVYYTLGYYEARENNWDLSAEDYQDIAEDNLLSPDFIYQLVNNGEDLGSYYIDNMAMITNTGAASWENMYPDDKEHTNWGNEAAWRESVKYKAAFPVYEILVNSYDDIRAIKHLLNEGYIMSISINAEEYFKSYTDNNIEYKELWTVDNYDGSETNHANTIVGYDDNYNGSAEDITIK